MRNFLLKTVFATFCFSLVFALLSCDGIAQKIDGGGQDTESEQEFIITGTLSVDGAVPSEIAENNLAYAEKSVENESKNAKIAESKNARSISGDFESGASSSGRSARTAIPSIPSSTTYTVTATSTSGGKPIQGEVNGNSFTIKLSSAANETWTVKVEGFSASPMAANTKILEGSKTVTLNANTVNNNISITLSPISSGSGRVSLPISVAADSGIQSAIVKIFEDAGETRQINVTPSLEYDFSTTKDATISASVTAGSRYFVFTFYSVNLTAAKQNPKQNIAYQAHEAVNVFQNLETSIWQGNSPYLTGTGTDTNKTFLVTKDLADTFNCKEFYVQGTSGTYNPPTNASDDNSGTYFDPFATIQKAVDKVIAINDETSTYKIIVDGTLEITSQSDSSAVIIQPEKNLNLTIESHSTAKATIKAKSTGDMRVFIVGNGGSPNFKPNVTMKNLIITGGKNETGGGAGIKLEAGNLTLSNVEVTNNSTTYGNGGGIYVEKDTSLTINEGSKISNNSAENGGGIYMASIPAGSSGILNVTNSEISENTASKSGGGIFVDNGDCNITGGAISNNSAASKGGGVCLAFLNSTIKISGTVTMSGNQLTGQQKTGTAIYANAGATAELDGSSGNINITPAQGGALPTIYLEKGTRDFFEIPDAVLKLGGDIQIGTGNGTGINIEGKINQAKANIMITAELTSTQIINISYATTSGEAIIEGEGNYNLTEADCNKFRVNSKALDFENNKGIYKQ